MNKKVFLWGLYDFANTPLTAAIGGLFLAQWIVLDNHLDDIWYGGVFTLSTIFLLITSPFWGAWSDQLGKRKPFITWMTFILLIAGGLLGIVATSSLPSLTRVIMVLVLFFIIQYAYQVSLIFYNTLLKQLSTSKTMGKISGIGDLFSEAGWLLGPAILLPFATGTITLWGEPGRSQVFLPSIIILAVLGLPMIFWFKEKGSQQEEKTVNFKAVYERTIYGLKVLIRENKNATLFLIAFMLISDALLTAELYFAIYMDQLFKVGDDQKYLALALLEIVAIFSAYFVGKASDRQGAKKMLLLACWTLLFVFFLMSINSSLLIFYVLSGILGFGFAGFYVTSRTLLLKISPAAQHGEYFGFYSTFQKFASIIGPLIWGVTTLLLKNFEEMKYRAAIFAMALLILIGTLLMMRVKEKFVRG